MGVAREINIKDNTNLAKNASNCIVIRITNYYQFKKK